MVIDPLSILTDMMSMGSGGLPIGSMRMFTRLFRKKGLTKAQIKKLMMRRRRLFVDNVVMIHERRIQRQNLEDRIKEAKEEIRKKQKQRLTPRKKKIKPRSGPSLIKSRYGSDVNDEDAKQEQQEQHLTTVQQIVANRLKSDAAKKAEEDDKKKGTSR